MADHNKPTITSTYANLIAELDARLDDMALDFDPSVTSPSNLAVNTVRFNTAASRWEKWNGTTWVNRSSSYAIDITGNAATATLATTASTANAVAWGNVTGKPALAYADGGNYNLYALGLTPNGDYAASAPGNTRGTGGLHHYNVYNNGYPTTYGNLIHLYGVGAGQLLIGWSGTDGAHADNYIRSKRDNDTGAWSGWAKIVTDQNLYGSSWTWTCNQASYVHLGKWNVDASAPGSVLVNRASKSDSLIDDYSGSVIAYANNAYHNANGYGSLRVDGTYNGWGGINFNSDNCLMVRNNEVGFLRPSAGWMFRWYGGNLYCYKGAGGGIPEALVVDTNNSYARQSDNRPGTTRLYRYDDDSGYFVTNVWTGSTWKLEGRNPDGSVHAGCYVAESSNADTVDGWHRDDIRDWNNLLNKPSVPSAGSGFYWEQKWTGNQTTAIDALANWGTGIYLMICPSSGAGAILWITTGLNLQPYSGLFNLGDKISCGGNTFTAIYKLAKS